jgi:NAD(P)-dependent dehydrogenase (short-subunit alcohol dehydrogenase family)
VTAVDESIASKGCLTDPLFDVSGANVLVTGASSGLGRQFASALAERGARVLAVARREAALQDLATKHAGRIRPVAGDVTSEADVARMVAEAESWCGPIDVLVNNAGITSVQPAEQEDVATFARVIDVNLTALYRLCHHVGRQMLDNGGGSIINIASINGLVASWSIPEAGYCASKGAVISLTRELAAQWADRGIRVNGIAPGYFRSELTEDLFDSDAGERRFRRMPMRRAGESHELNGALVFLASQASSYMTGQILVVDGGWTAV